MLWCLFTHTSAARKSTSVLFIENLFRRLEAHACQAPLLQEALDPLNPYLHPWIDKPEVLMWGKAKHGTDWVFDPMVHHTSKILDEIRREQPALGATLQELWAGTWEAGTAHSSYRNRARELARICGETLDHTPGSIDMQLIERADANDGFQIKHLMRKATVLYADEIATSDFVDQDAILKSIKHKFVESGIHTYFAAYKRQLWLFVEMKLPFELPEQYNCQLMISHLITRCLEFKKCAQDFVDSFRLYFCAGVNTSVYHGFVHLYDKSFAILWIVCTEIWIPRSTSTFFTFGAVIFGSLNNSSTICTICGFSRFVFTLFSPRRSLCGSRCGVSAASLCLFRAR